MKLNKAIKILDHHNRWRRGNDNRLKIDDPKQLGIAIDVILQDYKNRNISYGCDHNWLFIKHSEHLQYCEFCNDTRVI